MKWKSIIFICALYFGGLLCGLYIWPGSKPHPLRPVKVRLIAQNELGFWEVEREDTHERFAKWGMLGQPGDEFTMQLP